MRAFLRYILMALVLLFVAMASALTAMRFAIHGREVAVPKLQNLTPSQAENAAIASGLILVEDEKFYSNEVAEGRIISQSPAEGTRVRLGWRVRVAVSLGPQRTDVPDLLGQSPRAAEINVQRRGLQLGSTAVTHLPGADADQVVAQSPAPGASGMVSPKIGILLSAPDRPEQYVMPNFIGRHLADVVPILEQAGFKLGAITDTASPAPPAASAAAKSAPKALPEASIILRQTPAPGQRIEAGSAISFEVTR